jgi:uncharacterized protein YcfJ
MRKYTLLIAGVLCLLALIGCARYERTVVPFKMPEAYSNAREAGGALIASKAFGDAKEAKDAFGFDIVGAGVLPVQVIFDNKGVHPLEINSKKTYLVDSESNLWPVIDASLAYDRIAKKTELGEVAPESTKSGLLAGTAGAIIGAAIGIVTGENVGDAAMKGAAVGAAAGMTLGGAKGLSEGSPEQKISEDLQQRTLEKKPVPPEEVSHGFIFFPGEAKGASELRLSIREIDTGKQYNLIMKY